MRKASLIIITAIASATAANAQKYEEYFSDSTLRVNCVFAGNAKEQNIYVDNMCKMPRWYGRKSRLGEYPIEGNTQFELADRKTGKIIYRNSMSTLFQEWLSYPEAQSSHKSFENVILMPMPKDTADLRIYIKNNRREVVSTITETIAPKDILIRETGKTPAHYEVLQQPADTSRCIHIAFLAEGYTKEEMPKFLADAQTATDAIFEHSPFKELKDRFSVIAVESESAESGTSVPSKGIWKNTALGSHFDTFYSERYLTTLNLNTVHDWLAGTPYEHIIILVNTDVYGGGGILNFYNLGATGHKAFKPVIVHEFGHSFAGLADEYAYDFEQIPMYPADVEPWEENITTLKDFHGKWEGLIKEGTPIPTPEKKDAEKAKGEVGLYRGAGYNTKDVYRGEQDCRMRTNQCKNFCTVCRNALTKLIKFYTGE